MAKKVMTVTKLKVHGDLLPVNTEVDVRKYKLTEDQLVRLHRTGAIKVIDSDEVAEKKTELTPADVLTEASAQTPKESNSGQGGTAGSSGVAGTNQTNSDKS